MNSLQTFLAQDAANSVEASANGYIGVGWAHEGQTFDFIMPREDGKVFEGMIHSPYNHKQRFNLDVLNRHPELRGKVSYTTLPRYRVYWAHDHNVIVGWDQLMELSKFHQHINKIYRTVRPVFTTEDHYNGHIWGPDPLLAMDVLNLWKHHDRQS
jgi:hypothetical protein